MLTRFYKIFLNRMSREKKVKETLANKLSGKRVPKKIQQKDKAETSSVLFKEVQNETKATKPIKLKAKADSNQGDMQIIEDVKSELLDAKRATVKRTAQKIKSGTNKDSNQMEVLTQIQKKTKSPIKKKVTTIKEEPSCSKKMKKETLNEKWEPTNWKLMLDNIRKMRNSGKAPVDTMGCHKCADENADDKTQRYQKLVALMLSSQTKDEITYHAMLRLRENNLTPEVINNMKVNVLENILHPVSFYKNKAKYLQQTSKILIEKYNSDIPNNIRELVALPGVGPKMAHICMATAWKEVTGIGVDVHVHRISNRIGWLQKPTKDPEQTRVALEAWLPQHLWSEVNYLLVGFGQTVCLSARPKCSECLNCEICPFNVKTVKKGQKPKNSKLIHICDEVKFSKSKILS